MFHLMLRSCQKMFHPRNFPPGGFRRESVWFPLMYDHEW
jgi:hypothetical protein